VSLSIWCFACYCIIACWEWKFDCF